MTRPLNRVLMRLTRRSETNDPSKLVNTFVDIGPLFALLSSRDHQIFYGRRGTGKTHALLYLADQVQADGDWAVYIDLRRLGSSGGIYADESLPLPERGTRLLLDALGRLHDAITDLVLEASYASDDDFAASMRLLESLADAVTQVCIEGSMEVNTSSSSAQEERRDSSVHLSVNPQSVGLGIGSSSSNASGAKESVTVRQAGVARHYVHFGNVSTVLERLVEALPCQRLWILLDEWSTLPLELQPYLADLLRRSVFPVPGFTVKIGAIEQRSTFRVQREQGDYIGIEVGADASADLDLDDFMVFGNDAEQAKEFFRELLFRHVASEIGKEYQDSGQAPRDAQDFLRIAFTQSGVFDELVRAAEGVPRDAMNVLSLAAQVAGNDAISMPNIRSAARRWYLRDKEKAVSANPDAELLLHWIIDQVIGQRRTKGFLLDQEGAGHPLIGYLYDGRVLHIVRRGISSRDRPGVRFLAYALDFGCYVHLTAAQAPTSLLAIEGDEGGEQLIDVPGDDYRSIRTALLDLSAFERSRRGPKQGQLLVDSERGA